MIAIIGSALTLLILVLGEFFAWKKRVRDGEEKFKKDQDIFFELAEKVLTDMRADRKKASEESRKLEKEREDSKPPDGFNGGPRGH